ncbi:MULTISPECIES: hypothetical protein [unclassified Citrobacter]|uniref:hypothetical protein n=1 Tax=unclassified Citrobacter TaxID=2644389 RepID=UPI0015E98180|nr:MULTISPECIES: hypothetical protein [unclassified Citrobacter]MBA7877189.1 hypothetical protein [Citrobacter sp. RHBSTW-00827]MBA7937769.1 hypothetical protein [Citrobacter sp. RHBSTW-00509]QLS93871.1 hypothetical protein HV302_07745 [Citrobacter sp. RHBSTW-00859]QLT53256.1 hypothetical protein HV285_07785 [Citrobacter sp. RHBSTW-00821]QLU29541.1 hypothetical protein HV199_07775 [Citrobacter sp. RHBSTW-00446]
MSKDFQYPPQLRLDYAVADIHFRKRWFRRRPVRRRRRNAQRSYEHRYGVSYRYFYG